MVYTGKIFSKDRSHKPDVFTVRQFLDSVQNLIVKPTLAPYDQEHNLLVDAAIGFSIAAIGNAVLFTAVMAWRSPGLVRATLTRGKRVMAIGGTASFVAYTIVIWAFTQAPIALVTALRETSIVFAMLIGVLVLKEKVDLLKVVSTMVTLLGAAFLRFAR